MSDNKINKVVIIGSGPAGLTAGIYASRSGLSPLIIEGMESGGQLMTTNDVENFPGFPDGITGPELISNMRKQAEKFGTKFVSGDVTSINLEKRPFTIEIADEKILTKTLIIATGAKARYPEIDSVKKMIGRGVSACATCDGFFFRDKTIFVIGGGDSAMEEAMFLTQFGKTVNVVHRRDELRASKIMQDLARSNKKIKFFYSHTVSEVLGEEEGKVTGIKLKDLKTNEETDYQADGIFFAIGHDPNISFLNRQLEVNGMNYLVSKPDLTATAVEGLYAAGDVSDHFYQQAITAAAEGCKAAIEAEKFLLERNEVN
ncbi:MAG: thioredoxin-disulfide reductase [Spirochaetes bacterium]|nr:thioredoxin-disulfide reductase [Spirochaetota bacterium]